MPEHPRPERHTPDDPAQDQEIAEQERLNALVPVDDRELEIAQQSIDEARHAAEQVRRQQGDDVDDPS